MLSLSSQTNSTPSTDDISFTFKVDQVTPKRAEPYLTNFEDEFNNIVGEDIVLLDSSHQNNKTENLVSVEYKMTGAVKAIHEAYMDHYNLKLSVSDFIIMIGQGLAHHMEVHSEELRHHFVDFEGKEKLTIETLQIDLPAIVEQFSLEIKKRVKTDFYDVIIDDTSVATKLSKMASEIAIMDAFKNYFKYEMVCACGIPNITLVGSKDDWERLRSKVRKLQELNSGDALKLDWWLKHLIPLVDQIVDQAVSRKVDPTFWSNIYKFHPAEYPDNDDEELDYYDLVLKSPEIDGWITKFIPYFDGFVKNTFDRKIDPDTLPSGVSKVPFTLKTPFRTDQLVLFGGFIGAQLVEDDTIEPAYFYAVGPDPTRHTRSNSR